MDSERPAPDAELNTGTVTVPRPAATVILLRGGTQELEVLLVQRNPSARFVGGAWVFPGGAVNSGEGEGQAGLRAAALRELQEEANVSLDPFEDLVPFARWITPPEVKKRFDTWFYVAAAPAGAAPRVDGAEVVDFRWISPAGALAAGQAGKLQLVLPTIRQLEQLAEFTSVEALIGHARGREIQPVQPRILKVGDTARIVLPGEAGYED